MRKACFSIPQHLEARRQSISWDWFLPAMSAALVQAVLETELPSENPAASPARVFVSRMGRVEVCTPATKHDGRMPGEPHARVLPDLLKHWRYAFGERTTTARGRCCTRGQSPSTMSMENACPSAPGGTTRFSYRLLCTATGCANAKRDTCAAVRAAERPRDVSGYTRTLRLARRVALRQLARTDGSSPALAAWREMFDRES